MLSTMMEKENKTFANIFILFLRSYSRTWSQERDWNNIWEFFLSWRAPYRTFQIIIFVKNCLFIIECVRFIYMKHALAGRK